MRYLLVHALEPGTAARHQTLIEDVAARFGTRAVLDDGLPPHLTMKYWFTADDTQRDALLEFLRAFTAARTAAPFRLGGVDRFGRTVFVDVAPSSEMRALQGELVEGLRHFSWMSQGPFDGPELRFHATIASYLPKAEIPRITAFIGHHAKPVDLLLDNLTLIGRTTPHTASVGDAHIIGTFPLAHV